jgi:cytochrome c2
MLFLVTAGSVAFTADLIRRRVATQNVAEALTGGEVKRAPAVFRRYGCGGCHTIAGVAGADGKVGGRLTELREQVYIGGVVTNTPQNLTAWIVSPQRFSPRSAMPATGISEAEARDVAAYLYSH